MSFGKFVLLKIEHTKIRLVNNLRNQSFTRYKTYKGTAIRLIFHYESFEIVFEVFDKLNEVVVKIRKNKKQILFYSFRCSFYSARVQYILKNERCKLLTCCETKSIHME